MNETWVTVVGNVASDVSWRRTPNGHEVANFRLMSTERRFDAENGSWEDGNRVAVSVACWRRLSENVRACVKKGDPVVVHGRLHVREYEVDGVRRTSTDIDARSVGLDLARVPAKVVPTKAAGADRSIVDVSGLTVVESGTGPAGASEEGLVGAARDGGSEDDGDDEFAGPYGEAGEATALAG